MITTAQASEQIQRLSGLDFFPRERAALKELRLAAESAATVEILRSIIDDWIREYTVSPKPADLRRLITPHNQERASEARQRVRNCPECGGSGYLWVEVGLYTGAKPCACNPGVV